MQTHTSVEASKSLKAILKKSHGDYWVVDLETQTATEMTAASAIMATEHDLTLLIDAKKFMKNEHVAPNPRRRLLCLTTIKKLLAKTITENVTIADFATEEEVIAWTERALSDALQRIEKRGIGQLTALECQVIQATQAMEERGIPFKKSAWENALDDFARDAAAIKDKLNTLLIKNDGFMLFGPEPIDLNNASAVKSAIEDLVGQEIESTSQSSLKNIDHEAVKLLGTYREYTRMLSTYGENFLAKISDDRLRGNFIPIGSASGRFACSDPNLLAMPNHPTFQACIAASAPNQILHFDYGAFELRILASLSGDKALLQIFNDKLDIHSMVACAIFNQVVSKTENSHLRDQAKVLNFGLIYGMGEQSLAKQLNLSPLEAKQLMQSYFKRFSRVGDFLESLESCAQKVGYAKTALGRRVFFADTSTNRGHIARVARNMPIQGTGADIVKLAMCSVFKRLYDEKLDAHLINVVHDELVVESNEDCASDVKIIVTEEMKRAFNLVLPDIVADVSVS